MTTSGVGIVVMTGMDFTLSPTPPRRRGGWGLSATNAHCVLSTPPRRTETGARGTKFAESVRRGVPRTDASHCSTLPPRAPAASEALPDSDQVGLPAGHKCIPRTADSPACGAERKAPRLPCTHSAATSAAERAIAPMQDVLLLPCTLAPTLLEADFPTSFRQLLTVSWRQFSPEACRIRGASHAPAVAVHTDQRGAPCLVGSGLQLVPSNESCVIFQQRIFF